MTGTTISASSTIGIQLTLPSQNPVLVTSTGSIHTAGSYAISDTAAAISAVDLITNDGVLQGQYGIEFNGTSAVGVVKNLGRVVGTTENAIYSEDGGDVNNGSATDTSATITTTSSGYGIDAILFNPQPEGDDLVINYGTISAPQGASDGVSMDAGQLDTLINYGTVSGGHFGIVTSGSGQATVTNGSTAYTKAVITGVFFEGASQTSVVTNYGTISSDANAADGIKAAGSLTVTNAGTIIGPDCGIFAAGLGTVTNAGSIVETVGGGPAIQLASGGSITNGSAANTTASIAGGTGIILGYIGGTGPVIQTPSQVTNFGTIDGTDGDAITTNDTGPVTITNGSATDTKALITSTFWGIATGIVTLANFGTIAGPAVAVDVAGGSSITNGSTADTVATIKGDTGVASSNSGNSTLNNFGTIATTGSGALSGDGVSMAGNLTNGSATDVKASITGSAYGVNASGVTTVRNFGTISGAADYGVALNSGTIDNDGTIVGGSGGIITGNGANVVNSGTIASSTTAGTALYFLTTGGTLVNDAGGVIGTTSGRLPTVVNDGTIVAGNGPGGLDVFSSVDPSSSGVFRLTGKSQLEIAAYLGTNLKIQFLGSTPTNELIIDNAANFGINVGSTAYAGPLLEGFTAGDEILLKGIDNPVLSYSTLTGELQLTSAGKPVATLLFQNSSLGAGTFHVTSESGTNYLITHS